MSDINSERDRPIPLRCPQTVGERGRHVRSPGSSYSCPGPGARMLQGRARGGLTTEEGTHD
jgi:hypothetical protein